MMAVEFIDISTKYCDEDIAWQGPGWYAPHQHYGSDRQQFIRYYHVGSDLDQVPETYPGLGSPSWFDEPKQPA